jgi:UPF0755 protein
MKRVIIIFIFLSFILIVILGFHIYQFLYTPPNPFGNDKIVDIPHGTPLTKITQILETEGIIKERTKFLILAKLYTSGHLVKAGEYKLSPAMLPLDVLDILKEGKTIFDIITIPEGYTIKQIAEVLASQNLVDKERFIKLTLDSDLIKMVGGEGKSLEGYLFPDTYHLNKTMSEESIIKKMVSRFWEILDDSMQNRAKELGFSLNQAITLASIIEKETGAEEERKLVSAVYHNRLKRKELLQSDPTVIYAIQDFNGNLTREDLKIDSPYNTYRYPGLPPGPIANPGRASLVAALYPADVDYLYFVSRNNGTHEFSSTLKQHNAAVKKYQLSGGAKNNKSLTIVGEGSKLSERLTTTPTPNP